MLHPWKVHRYGPMVTLVDDATRRHSAADQSVRVRAHGCQALPEVSGGLMANRSGVQKCQAGCPCSPWIAEVRAELSVLRGSYLRRRDECWPLWSASAEPSSRSAFSEIWCPFAQHLCPASP